MTHEGRHGNMNTTLLAELIDKHVTRGVLEAFASTAEHLGERWGREVLQDPAVRADMIALARAAFKQTLVNLHPPREDENG
jgi:hypothetical protein